MLNHNLRVQGVSHAHPSTDPSLRDGPRTSLDFSAVLAKPSVGTYRWRGRVVNG